MISKKSTWDDWFAGLVDGDGYFYINKKEEISFELTTHISDSAILYSLKDKLKGGSVKLRAGSKSIRYRVKKKVILHNISLRLNGKLQNPIRLKQFQNVCQILKIDYKPSIRKIQPNNHYLAGLIDSDGTVSISISHSNWENSQKVGTNGKRIRLQQSRGFNQIYLKVTSIHESQIRFIQESYQIGKIYQEKINKSNKKMNITYYWILKSENEFQWISDYFKNTSPLRSVKMHRIRLSLYYFHYKKLKYHLSSHDTVEYKLWANFCKSWFKYS